MLLDPIDAVLVHLFGFLWQHRVLQVCSVKAHGESRKGLNKKVQLSVWFHRLKEPVCGAHTPVDESCSAGSGCLSAHGEWQWLSEPSSSLWGISDEVHSTSCSLDGSRGPTEKIIGLPLVVQAKAYDRLQLKKWTHLTDAMSLIYDKPGQKASLIEVLQGRDQPVTCTDLAGEEEKSINLESHH